MGANDAAGQFEVPQVTRQRPASDHEVQWHILPPGTIFGLWNEGMSVRAPLSDGDPLIHEQLADGAVGHISRREVFAEWRATSGI